MNDPSPRAAVFPFSPMFSPLYPPANMLSSDEQSKDLLRPASAQSGSNLDLFRNFHHHTVSDSTIGSSNSSPTTTISTVDDSSATEPSPGSSPESPPPTTFAIGMLRPHTSDHARPFFELQRQQPPKKGRNLKNLAVDTSGVSSRGVSTSSLPLRLATNNDSLPHLSSPSFVKPPAPPKRKSSNLGLTLLTPASAKASPAEIKLTIPTIPPTPALTRPGSLRHFQSSPSLPLLSGPHTRSSQPTRLQSTLETIMSPVQIDVKAAREEEEEQNFDLPQSREEKPEAYPDGPICVYDPGIDLYLEPTIEQARQYDVVINVANEVRNPFIQHSEPGPAEPEIRMDGGGGIQYAPKRDLTSRLEATTQPAHTTSPTTPKATPITTSFPSAASTSEPLKEPEYIHQKWEHNSDIVPDLLQLVKLIDEKVQQGKRVLVHCQCGVSRSASLIVAYGLYKDPALSVQEAYDAVKRRSKWIGPNMNLIMQLQEFRTSLMNGGRLPDNRSMSPLTPTPAFGEWPTTSHAAGRHAPLSAGVSSLPATQIADPLSAVGGPSSVAPSAFAWPVITSESKAVGDTSGPQPSTAYVNTSGHVIPVVPMLNVVEPETHLPSSNTAPPSSNPILAEPPTDDSSDSPTPTEPLPSPRAAEFAMTPLQPSPEFDPADSFGLMSPSSTEFASPPFDRSSLLAQMGLGSVRRDDDGPPQRRSRSLRAPPRTGAPASFPDSPPSRPTLTNRESSFHTRMRTLRGKFSSPSIREQRELQALQARLEAELPSSASSSSPAGYEDALLSPRATEFMRNPFALAMALPSDQIQQGQVDERGKNGVGVEEVERVGDQDPRSPAQVGGSPITRNILDVL